jgi:hypothetical protein
MPDGDLYRQTPAYVWRRVYGQIGAGAAPGDVARPTRIALCHALRRGGGLPGLAIFGEIVTRVKAGELAPVQALQEIREAERQLDGSQHAKLSGMAASRLISGMGLGEPAPLDPALTVAVRACGDLVESNLLGLVEVEFVGDGDSFTSQDQVVSWLNEFRGEIANDVTIIARRLVADERAERLRAPARRRTTRKTADMLHEGLGSVA